jgi:hypothetical protein
VNADPTLVGGRAFTDVDGDIKNFALYHPHKFSLRLFDLIVQAPEDVPSGHRMVILHEVYRGADRFLETALVETLKKEAAIVAVDSWFEHYYVRYLQFRETHNTSSFR